ncbi:DUF4123 domain-containing protein [Pectobacterium colocasium]|uniref:DUF4123 domain-containing protein n=1 Tax=Pectobacterium TaxID=122277 RepID=UPI003B284228
MLPESIWQRGACNVLLEGAYLTAEQRERLSEKPFLPLYFHDDLFELLNLGPWLWQCPQEEERLLATLVQQGHVVGLLESDTPFSALQKQLALGVRVIEPAGKFSQLLRFYTPHALPLLVEQHDAPWLGGLFGGIDRWWLRECDGSWRELSLAIPPVAPVPVKLTPELYRALQGSPDEHRVLVLWLEGERCGHFPPCERMSMVRKALRKADQAGAIASQRRLWALAYLEGGRQALEEQKGRT